MTLSELTIFKLKAYTLESPFIMNPSRFTSLVKTWSSTGSLSTARRHGAGGGDATDAFVAGGFADGGETNLTSTEEFNGATWSSGGALSVARSQCSGGGNIADAIAFAGAGDTDGTEEYNGTSWSTGGDLGTGRTNIATECAKSASDALCISGYTGSWITACEEYNGTSWSAGGSCSAVHGLCGGAVSASDGLAMGGHNGSVATSATEEYGGTSWSAGGSMTVTRRFFGSGGGASLAIASGGNGSGTEDDAEQYDGASWAAIDDMINTNLLQMAGMSQSTGTVINAGGSTSYPQSRVNCEVYT